MRRTQAAAEKEPGAKRQEPDHRHDGHQHRRKLAHALVHLGEPRLDRVEVRSREGAVARRRGRARLGHVVAQRLLGVAAVDEVPARVLARDLVARERHEPLRRAREHAAFLANRVDHDPDLALEVEEVAVDEHIGRRVEDAEVGMRVVPAHHARLVGAPRKRLVHGVPGLVREGHAHLLLARVLALDDRDDARPAAAVLLAGEADEHAAHLVARIRAAVRVERAVRVRIDHERQRLAARRRAAVLLVRTRVAVLPCHAGPPFQPIQSFGRSSSRIASKAASPARTRIAS